MPPYDLVDASVEGVAEGGVRGLAFAATGSGIELFFETPTHRALLQKTTLKDWASYAIVCEKVAVYIAERGVVLQPADKDGKDSAYVLAMLQLEER